MVVDNLNSSNNEDNNKEVVLSTENIVKQNKKISNLREKSNKKEKKESIQAEIMSYFIQNPENNVTIWMMISKDTEDWCEVIDFWDAQYEDESLNNLFDWSLWKRIWWLQIKADETWEKEETFEKELVIDRKTDTKWMLFVWKKWFKIEQIEFDDITKYDTPYETYFAYNKNWKTYVKALKNEYIKASFQDKNWNNSWKVKFWTDWLKNLNPEIIKQMKDELLDSLKEAKNSWTLDATITTLLAQMPVPEEMKSALKKELYELALK